MPKASQMQADYRRGYPMEQCGVCQMYANDGAGRNGTCTAVQGEISPYGLCKYYKMLPSSFGHKLTGQHRRIMRQVYDHARGGPRQ